MILTLTPTPERSLIYIFYLKGTSAYAGPHYHKLYGRVTHVWGNRRGQPKRSAMQKPRSGRSPLVIRFASPSGKYEFFKISIWLQRGQYFIHMVLIFSGECIIKN